MKSGLSIEDAITHAGNMYYAKMTKDKMRAKYLIHNNQKKTTKTDNYHKFEAHAKVSTVIYLSKNITIFTCCVSMFVGGRYSR